MTQPLSIEPGTPLPWATTKRNPRKVTADGVLICTAVIRNMGTTRQNKNGKGEEAAAANAAYIVHACNTHPQLIETIKGLVGALEERDRKAAECPIDKPNCSKADREKCSRCGATASENCTVKDLANDAFVDAARAALLKAKGVMGQ